MDTTPTPSQPVMSAPKPMPGPFAIIMDSWKLFTSTWQSSFKTSIWFLYLGLAYFVGGLLTKLFAPFIFINGIILFAGSFVTLWIGIRMMLCMLQLADGKQPLSEKEESAKAWSLYISLLWIAFLNGLVVLGASLLLVLPGIYFMIALAFAQLILVDQGIRGTQALAASRALVKGRWWATFGRLLVAWIIFGFGIVIIMSIIGGIIGMFGITNDLKASTDQFVNGILQLMQGILYAVIMPLIIGFQVKMYRTLQKTR